MGRGILPRGLSWTDQETSIDRAETDSWRTRRNKKRREVDPAVVNLSESAFLTYGADQISYDPTTDTSTADPGRSSGHSRSGTPTSTSGRSA